MAKTRAAIALKKEHTPWVLALTIAAVLAVAFASAETDSTDSQILRYRSSGPYCGIYSVFAASRLLGREMNPRDLLKSEYVGSRKGSSLAELKRAAEDSGLHALAVGRLDTRMLKRSPYPMILHVKRNVDSNAFDHFEVFLGSNSEGALLYDAPRPIRIEPFSVLASRWSGSALVLSASPIDADAFFGPRRAALLIYMLLGGAVLVVTRRCARHSDSSAANSLRDFA